MDINQFTKVALKVTSSFEGNDGFSQITGNFDGQGLSAGALQWTFKMGTLQPIAQKAIQGSSGLLARTMPNTGSSFLAVINGSIDAGMTAVLSWNDQSNHIMEPYLSELKAFWGSVECVTEQVIAAQQMAQRAAMYANGWVQLRDEPYPPQPVTQQEFCFFFDVVVNNGSLRGLTYKNVIAQVTQDGGLQNTIQKILNWCSSQPSTEAQVGDLNQNATLWAGLIPNTPPALVDLWVLAWLRACLATPQYQPVVMNRKGVLSLGQGYVNSALMSFATMSDV